jgi:hypothetical protein
MVLSLNNAREENRHSRRIMHELPVGIAVVSAPFGFHVHSPQFHGTLRDVAMTGVQISAKEPINQGATVKLWITVVHHVTTHELKLHGYVAWSRPDDTGVWSVAGVHLHEHPKKHMGLWEDMVAAEVRRFDS